VAVVGRTGAGKSSIVATLLRLADIESGALPACRLLRSLTPRPSHMVPC